MLGSTVDTCSASVRDASGRNAHIFYGEVNSYPEVFFFVLTQNGEVCSVDASGALKIGNSMHELHVAGRLHDEE